jgi:hypothetical protein
MARNFEDYKTRLSAWVDRELELRGSYSNISNHAAATGHPILVESLRSWRDKKIKREIQEKSLEAIANYRGMTVSQARDWLDGETRQEKGKDLVGLIAIAPIGEVIAAMEAICRRLREEMTFSAIAPKSLNKFTLKGGSIELVRQYIESEFKSIGRDLANPADFADFRQGISCDETEGARLMSVLQGKVAPREVDLARIALALTVLTGRDTPFSRLAKMLQSEPAEST